MGKCNITDKELAEALEVTLDELEDICEFFDSDPEDDWALIQGVHFEWGLHGSRVFSTEGAFELCSYIEKTGKGRSTLKQLKIWVLRRDKKLKALMISRCIQEVSAIPNQIVFKNGRAFLAPRACRDVLGLGTRQDVLTEAFDAIQKPTSRDTEKESLEQDVHYFEDESKRRPSTKKQPENQPQKYIKHLYFSSPGLAIVSKHLGTRLTQEYRRQWMKAVAKHAPLALAVIEKHEAEKPQRIKRAMDRVRKQAGGRCQLTARRKSVHKFNLVVHHLFDQKTYPQFADVEINLIAIGEDIHNHFHQWMGGAHISCTVDDLERYIEEFGNSLFPNGNVTQATEARMQLSKAKKALRAML